MKVIDPAQGAGLEKVARVTQADAGGPRVLAGFLLLTSGDRDLPAQDS